MGAGALSVELGHLRRRECAVVDAYVVGLSVVKSIGITVIMTDLKIS